MREAAGLIAAGVSPLGAAIPAPSSAPVVPLDFSQWRGGEGALYSFGGRGSVPSSPDLERILALPRRPQVDLDERSPMARMLVEVMNAKLRRPDWQRTDCRCRQLAPTRPVPCITSLRPAQAWALYEIMHLGGIFGLLATGSGKTSVGIFTPMVAPGCRLALGLVPPNLIGQLWDEYQLWAEHWFVPTLVYGHHQGRGFKDGRPTLHVRSYHDLSQPHNTTLLKNLKPDIIYADEADALKSFTSARTKRFVRQFAEAPETRFCGWTGTPWDESVLESAHLMAFSLRENSPLPLDPAEVRVWADALDPSDAPVDEGALGKFHEPWETVHQGFHRRLVETLGVIATQEGSVSIPLHLHERKPREMPANVAELLDQVRESATRPDGEEAIDDLEVARWVIQVACGFFYRWRFPKMPRTPDGKSLTRESIARIDDWRAKRKAWRAELRRKLKRNEPHLDSEKLCTDAAKRAHYVDLGIEPARDRALPAWHTDSYVEWARVEDTIEHETEAVWVSDYLAEDAAAWGREHRGVIWYKHTTFGERVATLGNFPLYAGGPVAAERIRLERGVTSIVCSIDSHGRGRDGLQYLFNEQLITVPPSSGRMHEQVLARLHRPGQPRDAVHAWCYRHVKELVEAFDKALRRAKFAQDTWGAKQKIMNADCPWRDDE